MPAPPGALFAGHLRGDNQGREKMKTSKLRLVGFGRARVLTRDGLIGEFTEKEVRDSLYPPMG